MNTMWLGYKPTIYNDLKVNVHIIYPVKYFSETRRVSGVDFLPYNELSVP